MGQFEHKPIKRPVLAGSNAMIHYTGEKKSLQQNRKTFSKSFPIVKIRCFALMNAPTNALDLEVNHLRLFEAALVVASWRVELHCSRRNSPFQLRLACCARGRGVLYRSRGDPRTPFLRSARPHRCAWICFACKRAVRIVVGGDP
jgi:hypothetical protein